MSRYLADINFIVAVLHPEHRHSQQANAWLAGIQLSDSIAICRVTQMGAIRLLTRKLVMGEAVLNGGDAWKFVQRLFDDDRMMFTVEPAGFELAWQTICEWTPKGASAETDSYLAAFAIASKLTVVTFDRGFGRFPGLKVEIPV